MSLLKALWVVVEESCAVIRRYGNPDGGVEVRGYVAMLLAATALLLAVVVLVSLRWFT